MANDPLQELLALIGQKEVELSRLRIENEALKDDLRALKQWVVNTARDGRPLVLVEDDSEKTPETVSPPDSPEEIPDGGTPAAVSPQVNGELALLSPSP